MLGFLGDFLVDGSWLGFKQSELDRNLGGGSNSLRARPPFFPFINKNLQNPFPDDFFLPFFSIGYGL
jgi:hypothetical protein